MGLEPPLKVGKLQAALRAKAKKSPNYRFYALYDKVYRGDVLAFAYVRCLNNGACRESTGRVSRTSRVLGREQWLGELAKN